MQNIHFCCHEEEWHMIYFLSTTIRSIKLTVEYQLSLFFQVSSKITVSAQPDSPYNDVVAPFEVFAHNKHLFQIFFILKYTVILFGNYTNKSKFPQFLHVIKLCLETGDESITICLRLRHSSSMAFPLGSHFLGGGICSSNSITMNNIYG